MSTSDGWPAAALQAGGTLAGLLAGRVPVFRVVPGAN